MGFVLPEHERFARCSDILVVDGEIVLRPRNRNGRPREQRCRFAPARWAQVAQEEVFHALVCFLAAGMERNMHAAFAHVPNLFRVQRAERLLDVHQACDTH